MSGYHSGSGRLKHLREVSGTAQGVASENISGRWLVPLGEWPVGVEFGLYASSGDTWEPRPFRALEPE